MSFKKCDMWIAPFNCGSMIAQDPDANTGAFVIAERNGKRGICCSISALYISPEKHGISVPDAWDSDRSTWTMSFFELARLDSLELIWNGQPEPCAEQKGNSVTHLSEFQFQFIKISATSRFQPFIHVTPQIVCNWSQLAILFSVCLFFFVRRAT